jgi:hypothetical protein
MELVGMVLDFLDALAGAVAIACWWCTWVSPAKEPPRPPAETHVSAPAEIDRFLREARACSSFRSLPRQPRVGERGDAAPPA